MIEYLPGKHNPVADALSRKSSLVQAIQPATILEIHGLDLNCMKGEYPVFVEFSTPYNLAMAGEPGHYTIQDGWLLYKGRLCIIARQRAALIHDAHDSLVGGHRGINSTLEKLERSFFWPKLRKDVYNYVQKCQVCQKVKSSHQKPAGLLQPLPIPDGPFQDISMDFVGPLPTSHHSRNTMCFTIVDRFSKFVMLILCKHTSSAEEIARLFIQFYRLSSGGVCFIIQGFELPLWKRLLGQKLTGGKLDDITVLTAQVVVSPTLPTEPPVELVQEEASILLAEETDSDFAPNQLLAPAV
ncbi:hypothetical protein L7F22_020399 [Adiantum nelumboides]|nr:hypothetical protein [Adiantum nelumboides]